jgi:hypothetical protein
MPTRQQQEAGPLRRLLTAAVRPFAQLAVSALRYLTRPLINELSNLRAQMRAYAEGSIETTSAIGSQLRKISQQLDEQLPALERRIAALEARSAPPDGNGSDVASAGEAEVSPEGRGESAD